MSPYADLWSELNAMRPALDRAAAARTVNDLQKPDIERLERLVQFLKNWLNPGATENARSPGIPRQEDESASEAPMAPMRKQNEGVKRGAEQGSQPLPGEVLEQELETLLKAQFPRDTIDPVPKGQHGGEVLHGVVSPLAQECGTILWEFKRTKNWSDAWLAKLRDDQRTAKAEIAIVVSQALPEGIDNFAFVEGVWITPPTRAIPLAVALRHTLIETSRNPTPGPLTPAPARDFSLGRNNSSMMGEEPGHFTSRPEWSLGRPGPGVSARFSEPAETGAAPMHALQGDA